MCITQEV